MDYFPKNLFWIPGKVPSMNELLYAKQTANPKAWLHKKEQKPSTFVWNKYNDIKKVWTNRTIKCVTSQGFEKVNNGHFHYMVIEESGKRDPSNVFASTVKFIEDGLVKAGVMANDGHKQVLGIYPYITISKILNPGVFVWIANRQYMFDLVYNITINSEITLKRFNLV